VQRKLGRNPVQVRLEPDVEGPGGREGGNTLYNGGLQRGFQSRPVRQGPVGRWGGGSKERSFEPKDDRNVVRASGGERVGPLCKIWCEGRTSQGKVWDAPAPYERLRKTSEDSRGIEEGKSHLCRPVKVGGPGCYLILLEFPKGVGGGVVDVQVSQS